MWSCSTNVRRMFGECSYTFWYSHASVFKAKCQLFYSLIFLIFRQVRGEGGVEWNVVNVDSWGVATISTRTTHGESPPATIRTTADKAMCVKQLYWMWKDFGANMVCSTKVFGANTVCSKCWLFGELSPATTLPSTANVCQRTLIKWQKDLVIFCSNCVTRGALATTAK